MAIIWRLKPDILLVIHQSLIFDIVSPKVSSVWQYDIQHRTRHGPAFRIPKSLYFQLSSGLSTVASYYYKWWHLIACCAGVSLMGGLISGYGRARGVIRLSVAVTSTYTQASFIIHPVSGVINRYIYLLYYWTITPSSRSFVRFYVSQYTIWEFLCYHFQIHFFYSVSKFSITPCVLHCSTDAEK